MNDPDTTPAANSHLAPSRQRSRHFGTTRPAARIETPVTPIPSIKHLFLIATICKCIGCRSTKAASAGTPSVRLRTALLARAKKFLPSLPPCLLALMPPATAKPKRKAKENLIATTPKLKIAAISGKQRTSQKLIATKTPLPLCFTFASTPSAGARPAPRTAAAPWPAQEYASLAVGVVAAGRPGLLAWVAFPSPTRSE